jgi:hypothetical protein
VTATAPEIASAAVNAAFVELASLDAQHARAIATLDSLRINLTELALRFKPGDPKLVKILAEKKAVFKSTMAWLEQAPAQRRVTVKKLDAAKAVLKETR